MFQNLGHHFSTSVLTKAQSVTCLFGMYSLLGGLPDGSDGKESACNAGGPDSIPGSKIPWRRAWQPIPVFLLGEFYGQRSPAGYNP